MTAIAPTPMRQPGSVLLISCYELGHQPSSLAMPMAFLERAGFQPEALDLAVESLDIEKVARARFVGISVPMHTALRLGLRVAKQVRSLNPHCHLCFYGLYASLNAPYLLEVAADSAIGGEFEEPLVALVEALEAARPVNTEGVSLPGRTAGAYLRRQAFPAPSRSKLPGLAQYAHFEQGGVRRLAGYVEASRGCRHQCLHCPIPPVYDGRFFIVPVDVVLTDIRQQVAAGATHITFGDPDFLNGPGHALRIARAVHADFPGLSFDFTAKVEHILKHRPLFPELARLGCAFMVSAVESLSDTVLDFLEKGHTRADVFTALNIVRDAGICFRPTWVSFTPWTTLRDYTDMFAFVEAEGLIEHVDPVQYTIRLLIPPGSRLLTRSAIQPFLGVLDAASFSYRWSHPDPRMDELHVKVTTAVERAVRKNEDPVETFLHLRELAHAARGDRCLVSMPAVRLSLPGRPARLTEPWFC